MLVSFWPCCLFLTVVAFALAFGFGLVGGVGLGVAIGVGFSRGGSINTLIFAAFGVSFGVCVSAVVFATTGISAPGGFTISSVKRYNNANVASVLRFCLIPSPLVVIPCLWSPFS